MVLYKVLIKRSTGHRSNAQQIHWAYRHQPAVKSRAANTVNECHLTTYHEECLCTSLSADRNNPLYQQLLTQVLSLHSTAGRKTSLPFTWWLRGDMPSHSSLSTGCFILNLRASCTYFYIGSLIKMSTNKFNADCISKSCILWQDAKSCFCDMARLKH